MGSLDRRTWSQVPFGKKRYASLQSTHGPHRLNGNSGQGREAKELRCSGLVSRCSFEKKLSRFQASHRNLSWLVRLGRDTSRQSKYPIKSAL
jgi:hypothetical protein